MQTNPQYIRTDKAIKQALITLLKNKPFEKITVQDILDETPVTRSTFYKHFHSTTASLYILPVHVASHTAEWTQSGFYQLFPVVFTFVFVSDLL